MDSGTTLISILHTRTLARLVLVTAVLLWLPAKVLADASGKFVYTKRFDSDSVVLEVEWTYVRAVPSLTFGEPRVIWSGSGAPEGQAGSDGLFYNPVGDLLVANWQSSAIWKFDPSKTDEVIEGPAGDALAFHVLLHPNEKDFLATNAFGQITCGDIACFGVYDHTPLDTSTICPVPLESATQELLQPVTFIADENLNMFTIFSDGRDCMGCPEGTGIQFGGGGFASFDLDTTTSTNCSAAMTMTRLIPQEISAAHSMSWDPFLSNANSIQDSHSDFITFANSRLTHIRVNDPGSPGATAQVVSTVDMATEGSCASLLPAGMNEFDQGAVTGEGIALVGDEATGFIALVDYSQNNNGTMLDPENMVCLTSFLDSSIDDIAPLTGLGAKFFSGEEFYINTGHSGASFNPVTSGQGQLIDVVPEDKFMFLAWFTFTDAASNNPDQQHWYTAQGNYSGNTAPLILSETLGGRFDDPQETSTNPVGTVTLRFTDCGQGEMTYSIDTDGREGTIPLQRLIAGSDDVCEEQSGQAAITTEAVDINAGMDGTWVNNDTLGQGFLIDAHPNEQGGNFIFVAWFTYGDDTASGQRWLTAQGDFAGSSTAEIPIYETTGGGFNDPQLVDLDTVGTMTIDFEDCSNAQLSYSLTDDAIEGDMAIIRLIPGGQALCEELNGAE